MTVFTLSDISTWKACGNQATNADLLIKKIVVSPDVWMVIFKDLNQNPESVKAVISNMKEQDIIFMLSEAIRTVEESGSSA